VPVVWIENLSGLSISIKMEWRVYCIYDEAIKGDEKERVGGW
jgi:hypothetical protein